MKDFFFWYLTKVSWRIEPRWLFFCHGVIYWRDRLLLSRNGSIFLLYFQWWRSFSGVSQ